MFNFFGVIGAGQINKMGSILRYRTVIAQLLDLRDIMFQPHKFNVAVLDLPGPVPYIHNNKHKTSHNESNVTAVNEFIHQCNEITRLH